jgi:iron only hydrogenase large subunit-like protein
MHCNVFNHAFIGTKKTIISSLDKPINLSNCYYCGQCSYHCPTSALYEKSYIDNVEIDPQNTTLIFDSAAVYNLMSQINSNFTKNPILSFNYLCQFLGFKKLINLGELIDAKLYLDFQLLKDRKHPIISNLCPVSIEYIKQKYPELIEFISPLASPMQAAIRLTNKSNPILILTNCSAYKNDIFQNYSNTEHKIYVANVRDFLKYLLRNGYTLEQLKNLIPNIKAKKNYSYSIGGLYADISMYNLLKLILDETNIQIDKPSKINSFLTGKNENKKYNFRLKNKNYSLISINTISEIANFFDHEFLKTNLALIGCWSCANGCINGGGKTFEIFKTTNKSLSSRNPLLTQIYNINEDLIIQEKLWKQEN